MLRLDHVVLHVDPDPAGLQRLQHQLAPLGSPFELPSSERGVAPCAGPTTPSPGSPPSNKRGPAPSLVPHGRVCPTRAALDRATGPGRGPLTSAAASDCAAGIARRPAAGHREPPRPGRSPHPRGPARPAAHRACGRHARGCPRLVPGCRTHLARPRALTTAAGAACGMKKRHRPRPSACEPR
jgi:hypothetical protein